MRGLRVALYSVLTQEGAPPTKGSSKPRPSTSPRSDADPAFRLNATSPAGHPAAKAGKPLLPTHRYSEFLHSPRCSRSAFTLLPAFRPNKRLGLICIRPRSRSPSVASSHHLPCWRSPDTATEAPCW